MLCLSSAREKIFAGGCAVYKEFKFLACGILPQWMTRLKRDGTAITGGGCGILRRRINLPVI